MENEEFIKSELAQMDNRLTEMEEKIDTIDKKINQVIDAISGNRLTKSGGFVSEIEVLKDKINLIERKQEKFDEFKKRIGWTVGIVVSILLIFQYLTNIYSKFKGE
jgi:prefoldin subunit 5